MLRFRLPRKATPTHPHPTLAPPLALQAGLSGQVVTVLCLSLEDPSRGLARNMQPRLVQDILSSVTEVVETTAECYQGLLHRGLDATLLVSWVSSGTVRLPEIKVLPQTPPFPLLRATSRYENEAVSD